MKKKDIKKIFINEIESHIPESAPKIDFPFVKPQPQPNKRNGFSFKLKYVMTTALAVLMVVAIIALQNGPLINPIPQERLLKNDNEVISFSAVSSISLMSNIEINEPLSQRTLLTTYSPSPVIEQLMPYLTAIEQLLSSDQGLNITTGESEMLEYSLFMTFETKDLLGNVTQYVMHYNMILIDEDEDEVEYDLEGILIFGSSTYNVIGKKEIEDNEEKLSFKAFKDSRNYVESLYEIENDKQKFEFKVVQNNITISESKFEIEYDDDEIQVQLEFEEGLNEGEFEFEYFEEEGINLIRIEFDTRIDGTRTSGEMTVQLIIDEISGVIKYRIYIDPDDGDAYDYETEKEDESEEEDPSLPEPTEDTNEDPIDDEEDTVEDDEEDDEEDDDE
jgi:hypothetical protein